MTEVSYGGFNKQMIESILAKKVEYFVEHLNDTENNRQNFRDHFIITGGAIVSLLLGEAPNDFDIYFDDVDKCEKIIANVIQYSANKPDVSLHPHDAKPTDWKLPNGSIRKCSSGHLSIVETKDPNAKPTKRRRINPYIPYYGKQVGGIKPRIDNPKYTDVQITTNCVTMDDVQLITRICGSPMDIHKTFDFVHCVSYFSYHTGLVLNRYALEAITTKTLKYIGGEFPIDTLIRMRKFIERGWTIDNRDILKIAYDISLLNLFGANTFKKHTTIHGMYNQLKDYLPNLEIKRDDLNLAIDKSLQFNYTT